MVVSKMMLSILLFVANLYLAAGQKAGVCPVAFGGSRNEQSVDRCQTDHDCAGQRKCCETLIGKSCMLPDVGSARTTPSIDYNEGGSVCPISLPASFSRQEHVCFSDADCKGGRRCCSYGGVRRCLNKHSTSTNEWNSYTTQYYQTTPYWTTTRPTSARPPQGYRCKGENEEYSECAPLCPKGCDNLHDKPTCSGCKPGCKCQRGFHRLVVDDATSPCIANEVCMAMTSKQNCPDGSVPQSVCRGKYTSCPPGTSCNNGICCPPFNRPSMTTQKPGLCPNSPPRNANRLTRCNGDSQCYGIEKCCPIQGGRVCMNPAQTTTTTINNQRPGGNPNIIGNVMDLLGLGNLGHLVNVGR